MTSQASRSVWISLALSVSACAGGGEGACDIIYVSGSARGRFCYDDFTESECDDLATELESEWAHYADQTCKDRGCEGGGTCSSTVR